jgi:nitrogenase molybdenum-iron protein beta chain
LTSIFEQYLGKKYEEKPEKIKGLVNLFAGPPIQDPFWLGNLRELEKLLTAIGLTPNTIFGFGRGLANVDKIPQAEFSILVSPWVGIESVEYLKEEYDIPYLHYPVLPIGAFETSKFLRAVAEFTGADKALTEKYIDEQEAEYYYYIERYADLFLEMRIMSKRFVAAADAQYSLALTKFLVNDLGMFPTTQYITDDTPKQYRDNIVKEFENLNYGIKAKVAFLTDGHVIHAQIKEEDFGGNPLILGSSWENQLSQDIGGNFVNITYPVMERLIMNSAVAGYAGGLKLIEDIYSVGLSKLIL